MASTIRIKKRVATGSTGAPSSLASSELAYNEADNKLYYGFGDNGSGVATSIPAIAGSGAYCALTGDQTVAGTKTFSGDVVISQNLTVNGTTTSIQTTNSVVKDALIELGNGTSGSPSNDAGLVIERGSSPNAFIGWDESEDKFIVGTGTFTGSDTGNLSISGGTLVATTFEGALTGNASGSSGSCTGNAATATSAATLTTARTIGGTSFDGSANIAVALAATTTALATARTIGGVSFDGTANIALPGVNSSGNQNTSGTAAIATTVTVADESTDTTCFPLFAASATGNLGPKSGTNLTFNSSSGDLVATSFSGLVDGGTF